MSMQLTPGASLPLPTAGRPRLLRAEQPRRRGLTAIASGVMLALTLGVAQPAWALFGDNEARRKLFTRYYHQQQGLLQIYDDFCLEDASDCRDCPFPEQLAQWRNPAPAALAVPAGATG